MSSEVVPEGVNCARERQLCLQGRTHVPLDGTDVRMCRVDCRRERSAATALVARSVLRRRSGGAARGEHRGDDGNRTPQTR